MKAFNAPFYTLLILHCNTKIQILWIQILLAIGAKQGHVNQPTMSLHESEGETEALTALISNSLSSVKAYLSFHSYS